MTHKNWWHTEGSGIRPLPNEDIEEFAKRITEIAWSNGEYMEREACAELCKTLSAIPNRHVPQLQPAVESALDFYAEKIRARGEA